MISTRREVLRLMSGGPMLASTVASLNGANQATSILSRFAWPDPATKGTILVNVTQDIIHYMKSHPEWFLDGELILSYTVLLGSDRVAAARQYQENLEFFKSKGLVVGTYISGTTAKPEAEQTRWPYETVPTERLPQSHHITGFWPKDPHRRIIDVTDAPTRIALQAGIKREWQAHPAPLRFVDNVAAHKSAAGNGVAPWDVQCEYIRGLREIGEDLGSRMVFNMALHVGFLTDREAALLIQAVGQNGIALEDPWTPHVRRTPVETKNAVARYRQLLEAGMVIVMLPLNVPEDELERWVHSWNKPAYHLYFGGVFFKKPTHGVRLAPPPA